MRKIILAFLFMLVSALGAFAQSTTVSGTVTDASSQAWANGKYSFTFQPNPQFPTGPYTWSGGTLNNVISGTLDSSGAYSVSIPSNSAITPAGSTWILQVTPDATSLSFSTARTTITGGTQTLNAIPPTILISWSLPPGPAISAYTDAEIGGSLPKGAEYFNTTSNLTRVWNGSAWANQGAGGGGGITGSGTPGFIPAFVTSTSLGNSTCDDGVTVASTFNCVDNIRTPNNVIASGFTSDPAAGGDVDVFCNNGVSTCHNSIGNLSSTQVTSVNGNSVSESSLTSITRSGVTIVDTVGTASGVTPGSVTQRAVTATTDTIVATDRQNRVAYNSTSAVAVTLPQAGSSGFAGGFNTRLSNQDTGVVTVTPTTSTINGNATLVMQEGQFCFLTPSAAGTDYAADCGESQMTAGNGISFTRAVHGLTITNSAAAGITNNVIPKGTGTSLTNSSVTDNGTTVSTPESGNFSAASTTSNPSLAVSGTMTTGAGSFPALYVSPAGTTAPTFNTNGSGIVVNTPSGFTGNSLELRANGGSAYLSASSASGLGVNSVSAGVYRTNTNCSSAASPAVCAAAPGGSVAIPAGALQTLQINTTAVTANSQILLTIDSSLGTKLGVTCNTTVATLTQPVVTLRSAGSSFTIEEPTTTSANPVCVSYLVFN